VIFLEGKTVTFNLSNKGRHAFKNIVVKETVPGGAGFRGVSPRPSRTEKRQDGSVHLEWRFDYMGPREKIPIRYTVRKKGLFMPEPKIVKYERCEERERPAREADAEAGKRRGLLGRLFGR